MTALDDIAFLSRSSHRVAALETLAASSYEQNELQAELDISRSTIKRILRGFIERGWVVRHGRLYEVTPLGERVAERFTTLIETIEAESNLREVVQWLPTTAPDFEIELFADATVTTAEPGAPYRPMKRLMDVAEETDSTTVRSFGTRPLPGYFERWEVREETKVEVIFSPIVVDALRRSPPKGTGALLESGVLTFLVHDDLPCGLTVFDDCVALCGYDQTTGMLQGVIDTENLDAVEWGENIYRMYRCDARPVEFTSSPS